MQLDPLVQRTRHHDNTPHHVIQTARDDYRVGTDGLGIRGRRAIHVAVPNEGIRVDEWVRFRKPGFSIGLMERFPIPRRSDFGIA